jgi:glutathione peroxidase
MTAIQGIPLETITGDSASLGAYHGQVLLVVNVASRCGLTPQYEALERLHEEYLDRGFSVLGFPANDFAGQEPGTNEEIAEFCRATFGVRFPMFGKIAVTGEAAHPLYRALTAAVPRAEGDPDAFRRNLRSHGVLATEEPEVVWNFEKFLVSRAGEVVGRFAPDVVPDDPRLRTALERELDAPPPPERVTVTRRIAAPAAAVFATVSDPAGHVEIDGSGMLLLARHTGPLTAVGDTFVVDMDREPLGDIPMGRYSTQSTVTRIEPDRLVEWAPGGVGRNPYGHVYGYALTPVDDVTTDVALYCDWSGLPERRKARAANFPVVPASMLEKTLSRLESLLTVR